MAKAEMDASPPAGVYNAFSFEPADGRLGHRCRWPASIGRLSGQPSQRHPSQGYRASRLDPAQPLPEDRLCIHAPRRT